jgi:hypothetical protein
MLVRNDTSQPSQSRRAIAEVYNDKESHWSWNIHVNGMVIMPQLSDNNLMTRHGPDMWRVDVQIDPARALSGNTGIWYISCSSEWKAEVD